MYAVVQIAGQQFKVSANQEIYVNKLSGNSGDSVKFDQVLLVSDNGSVKVGQPTLSGVSVKGTIVEHLKDEKVIVFKKKRRKGYKKKNGNRQALTQIQISGISLSGAKKAAAKKEAAPAEETAEAPKKKAAPKAAKEATEE